jgi:mannitol-1-/sugar-/sorbitol-6-phosphatase
VTQISCRALLFDLDGVLVDSTPAVERVWANWARERGFDPEDVVRRAHGRPSLSTIRELLPNDDHEAENRIVERREIEDLEGVVAAPGAQALLKSLPRSQWTIVTSCTRALAEVRIRAAGLPVPEKFITSTDIQNGKPHPEPYLKGAALLGLPASDCVVVEDAPAGVRSGKAAGARVIGLLAIASGIELAQAGASWTVKDCSAISLIASADVVSELRLKLVEAE